MSGPPHGDRLSDRELAAAVGEFSPARRINEAPVIAAFVAIVIATGWLAVLASPEAPGNRSAEAGFARDMADHHAQAVVDSQQAEIAVMEGLLVRKGASAVTPAVTMPAGEGGHGHALGFLGSVPAAARGTARFLPVAAGLLAAAWLAADAARRRRVWTVGPVAGVAAVRRGPRLVGPRRRRSPGFSIWLWLPTTSTWGCPTAGSSWPPAPPSSWPPASSLLSPTCAHTWPPPVCPPS